MKLKHIFYILFIILFSLSAKSQIPLSIATELTNNLNSKQVNPALIAYNNKEWSIDLLNINAMLDQDYGLIRRNNIIDRLQKRKGLPLAELDELLKRNNNKAIDFMGNIQVQLFGIYANYKKKHHFFISNGIKSSINLKGYQPEFLSSILSSSQQNGSITAQNMSFNQNIWNETGLSYATTIWDNEKSSFGIGTTLKYLNGLGIIGINIKKLEGTFMDKDSFQNNVNIQHLDLKVASDWDFDDGDMSNILKLAQKTFKPGAFGSGIDIGFVYELKQEGSMTYSSLLGQNYKLRVAASFNDLGFINYRKATVFSTWGSGSLNSDTINKIYENIEDIQSYLEHQGISNQYQQNGNQIVYTPASFNLITDYNIDNRFYISAFLRFGLLNNKKGFNARVQNVIGLSPRFQVKNWSVALPIYYSSFSNNFKAGWNVRFHYFHVGADDALAMVFNNQAKGLSVYAGCSIPLTFAMKYFEK